MRYASMGLLSKTIEFSSMIPVPVFGFLSLLLLAIMLLLPFIAVFGSLWALVYFARCHQQGKHAFQPRNKKHLSIGLLLLIIDTAAIYLMLDFYYFMPLRSERIEERRSFILSKERVYGELIVPAGTQVYRVDNFDGGAKNYPITFTEQPLLKFPHPVLIAGIPVTELNPGGLYPELILARDHVISGHYCQKGQVAIFDNLANSYKDWENRDENGRQKPPPEGREAPFHPSLGKA